jgi:FemAB-related protein (PEP-CTERM system-associated)
MQTVLLQDHNRQEWDAFVDKHPQATFYHHSGWKNIMENCFGHPTFYLMAKENNHIHGILPIVFLKSRLFGSIFCSMPFLNFGGICTDNVTAEKALINAAKDILNRNHGDYLELRHISKSRLDLPRKTHKVSMTLSLNQNPKILWDRFKSKHRTNIRRAEKHGLIIKSGHRELFDDFFNIICIGWRDLGTPLYHRRFFEMILQEFEQAIEIFVIYFKDRPIATAFNGRFKNTIEGMWTYALRDHVKLQTNNFLYWKMIEKACLEGFEFYHLGRSTNKTGATVFKKKWNADPTQLYWEYVLPPKGKIPNLSVSNPKYQIVRKAWQRMPITVSRVVGPLLAPYIP